jgi:dolichyl-phosphate-mannose--protein O-mannosyl transferase
VYLIGNVVVWMAGTLAVAAVVLTDLWYLVCEQRGACSISPVELAR